MFQCTAQWMFPNPNFHRFVPDGDRSAISERNRATRDVFWPMNADGRIFTLSPSPIPTYWRWTSHFEPSDYVYS